jgi:cobalt-zinc-cadmium efflux system protein
MGEHHDHVRIRAGADRRWLLGALVLIMAFMAAEVVVALAAHSLALVSDAAHMLIDAGALALALVALRLGGRPPRGGFTYGLRRAEILSAQANDRRDLESLLRERYHLTHTTLQLDHAQPSLHRITGI